MNMDNMSFGKKFWYASVCPKCKDVLWSETSFGGLTCHCGGNVPEGKRVDERELEIIRKK